LETNLSQYQQTYASLLQSYEEIRVAEAQSTSNVVQVEPATPPERPIRPRTLINTTLATVVGLMIAVGVVFLVEALDDTVQGPDDITHHLALPVLGLIARTDNNGEGVIASVQPRSPVTEAFRSLRTNIQYASVDRSLHTLLITSPTPEDGKTTVTANLGVVMAQTGLQVAIVDADMRRPRLHEILQKPNRKGLSEIFVQSEIFLDGVVQPTETTGLALLSSGVLPPNPAELVGSEKMTEILRKLIEQIDLVVIDTPPVMAATDAAVLAPRVDGVLLVIKPGVTKLGACRQTVEQLRRGGANLLGVVLNDVEISRRRYSYYYQSYYYASEYTKDAEKRRRWISQPHNKAG
jgi:non-specific protein-tyrosine kinase